MFEIPVAGAGPAGLAAALTLPLFYMVRCGVEAGSLDQGLKRHALDHDIELRLGTVLAVSASGVRATGRAGPTPSSSATSFPTTLPDALIGALSDRLAPQGYACVVTAGGRGTLACCIFADRANYHRYLDRTVAFFQARAGIDLAGAPSANDAREWPHHH